MLNILGAPKNREPLAAAYTLRRHCAYLEGNTIRGQNCRKPGEVVKDVLEVEGFGRMESGKIKIGGNPLSILFRVPD
jgi:hypothetical protein